MEIVHGFRLEREEFIPELNTKAWLYRHEKSGAELMSLSNDDENKVFGITFRTPPPDSTGVAHIMEHCVLGGSRKYKVKEPFIELVKGSLNTFVNAFTSSDWTTYPTASTNLQDFYNLVDVYLDAVFFPLITPHHLDQEGWHYELFDAADPLTYKGVVFNEMKGAYSSPDQAFGRYNQRSLFENHVYGLDSGGDPTKIPDLTYQQFKQFHEKYYHPVNSRIFFYGDDDPEERLKILDGYLKDFSLQTVNSAIPLAERYDAPRHYAYPYSVDGDDVAGKGRVQLNWLLSEGNDPDLTMSLSALSYALVSTPASPLRKALIDSGLGEEVTGGGLSGSLREMIFGIGLKGINVEDADKVESLILDTLSEVAKDGLEKEMVEAAVNTIEFTLREHNTGSFPRGLGLMLSALNTWLYDHDPLVMLYYEAPLKKLKENLETNSQFLQNLIKQYLIDNPHRSTVLLEPDPELAQKMQYEEEQRLEQARATMGPAEIQAIIDNSIALKTLQETPDTPEALASIPTLSLEDLERDSKVIPIEVEEETGVEVIFHDLFTNGIVYLDAGFDLHALPADLLPYVNLFGASLTKMGTESQDFVRLTQRIRSKTGGVWHSTMSTTKSDSAETAAFLLLRGKSTVSQTDELLDIFRDVLLTANLDDPARFRQIVLEAKAGEEAGLVQAGHAVVRSRLSSHLNEAAWVSEQMGGLSYLFFLNQLLEEIESNWAGVLGHLEEVREALIQRESMFVNVTLDAAAFQEIRPSISSFLNSLPAPKGNLKKWSPDLTPVNEGLTIPAQVNYVGKGANIYDLGYELHGSITVISNLLRTTWLWEKIRVQGGAYGAGGSLNRYSGIFSYWSYRDPNLLDTISVFDQTADFLRNLDLHEDELLKAIIGAIGEVDAYQLPDAKGYTSLVRHLLGVSEESRQKYRDEILSTSITDFKAFADALDKVKESGTVAILGAAEAINSANENGWLSISKVL